MAELVPLVSLNKRFHYYEPSKGAARASSNGHRLDGERPRLILIASFMGAPFKHMHRFYVQKYHERFPNTPIVLVMALPADWRPFSRYARQYDQLLDLLGRFDVDLRKCATVSDVSSGVIDDRAPNPMADVLIHTMSNGGCWCLKALLSRLSAGGGSERVLQPRTLVLDSCPGVARYSITLRAFLAALAPAPRPKSSRPSSSSSKTPAAGHADGSQTSSPAPTTASTKPSTSSGLTTARLMVVRGIAAVLITLWYGLAKVVNTTLRRDPIGSLRAKTMLQQIRPTDSRLYLYGDDDDLVYSPDVEHHAEAAIRDLQTDQSDRGKGNLRLYDWVAMREHRHKPAGYTYTADPAGVRGAGATARAAGAVAGVTLVNFGPSPHVAHSRTDPDRYWAAIEAAWSSSATPAES